MNALITIHNGIPTTTSVAIAEGTQRSHKTVIQLVRQYQADLEEFGQLAFVMRVESSHGAGQKTEVAILSEHQATLILTYMRNTTIIRGFKKALVKAFYELAEKGRVGNASEPLDLEDQILLIAQAAVEQKNHQKQLAKTQLRQQEQINDIAKRQDDLDGNTGYMTALAFCRREGIPAPLAFTKKLGKKATGVCKLLGITIGIVPDERWGTVGSYPIGVLRECISAL